MVYVRVKLWRTLGVVYLGRTGVGKVINEEGVWSSLHAINYTGIVHYFTREVQRTVQRN